MPAILPGGALRSRHPTGCHDIGVSDGRLRQPTEGDGPASGGTSIDELLDQAVAAINRGDREAATTLVGHVLAADGANTEAEDLLAAPGDPGEIRRLTIFFADLVFDGVVDAGGARDVSAPGRAVPRAGAERGAALRRAHRQQGR